MSIRVGEGPHKDTTLFIVSEIHLLGSRSARCLLSAKGTSSHCSWGFHDATGFGERMHTCILTFPPAQENTECGWPEWLDGQWCCDPGEREVSLSVCGRLISLLDPNSPSASVWDVPQSTIRGRFVYPHFHWAVRAVPVEKVILEAALNCMRPPGDRLGMPLPSFAIKFLNGLKKLMHLSHCLHSKKRIIDWKNWVQRMPPLLLPHKPQKHHRHLLFRKGRCAVPKANATGSDGALGPVSGNWKTKPGKKVGNTENANRGLACFLNPLNGN